MDARGAWVELDRLRYQGDGNRDKKVPVISTQVFVRHIGSLAAYIAASK